MRAQQIPQQTMIYVLALVIFLDVLTIGLVVPIFATLFNDPHGILPTAATLSTRTWLYSLIISLPMFALLFGSPLLGELSDRWGRKRVLLISLLGVLVSCLLSAFSLYWESVILLFISRILVALMDGSQAIAQAAIVDMSRPEDKIKNMSLITLTGTLGFIVGPMVGGVLSDSQLCSWFNYGTPFWVAAAFALVNFFVLKTIFHDPHDCKQYIPSSWSQVFIRLAQGFVDRRYWRVSLAFIAIQFCWAGIFQASSFLLAEKFHYTGAQIGIFTAYLAAAFSFFLLIVLPRLLRRFSTLRIAQLGIFTLGAGMLIYVVWVDDQLAIWLAIIPVAAGMALAYNTLLGLFSNAVADSEQGKVMGITVGFAAIAWLFGGFYVGHMASISYHLCFAGAVVVALLGFICLLGHREHK